jgi:hypothetical protein
MRYTFEAIPSGDGECFCFKVDKETYIMLLGQKAYDEEIDFQQSSAQELGLAFKKPEYMFIYPHVFFNGIQKLKISITVEPSKTY